MQLKGKFMKYITIINGVLVYFIALLISFALDRVGFLASYQEIGLLSFFIFLIILLSNPLVIYVIDYIVNPARLNSFRYIPFLLIASLISLWYHPFYEGVLEIGTRKMIVLLVIQFFVAYILSHFKTSKLPAVLILMILPLYVPLSFARFLFSFITGYTP